MGETFAGVPFEVGLDAVEELRPLVPDGATLAQFALRWILMHDAVSTVIPGARSPEQARGNAAAAALPALDDDDDGARRARSTTSASRRTCTSAGSRVQSSPARRSLIRRARARIVSTGLTPPLVTCSEPSATVTPSWPHTRPHGSVTEVRGSAPMRQLPAWCWPALGPVGCAQTSAVVVRAPLARSHSSARSPRNAALATSFGSRAADSRRTAGMPLASVTEGSSVTRERGGGHLLDRPDDELGARVGRAHRGGARLDPRPGSRRRALSFR